MNFSRSLRTNRDELHNLLICGAGTAVARARGGGARGDGPAAGRPGGERHRGHDCDGDSPCGGQR